MALQDRAIPYDELEALFLDIGNTLVSIDFDWIAEELAALDTQCGAHALRRAEIAMTRQMTQFERAVMVAAGVPAHATR